MSAIRRPLFVATVLAGSFLLFMVQPLVARMALPRLGGAPAVWNSAMLVYQALLLGGYAYAHALARLRLRVQATVHLALLAFAGLTLPIVLADLAPPAPGWEAAWVPLLFLLTIGPVFFAVSAQAPLMQRWYAADPGAGDPYWLYAASNLGSFAGLLAYPLLLEPYLPLAEQSLAWSVGYGALLGLVALAAWSTWRAPEIAVHASDAPDSAPIGWRRIVFWLLLAAVPSGLMLSTTTHLTTDIMAMPLLWVIPLGLYLLSFVSAFAERSLLAQYLVFCAPLILLLAGGMAMISGGSEGLGAAIGSLALLYVVAVALHRRLFLDRPETDRLTQFYLVMSAGGALGGLFAALIAPVVFDWVWEHPLLVLAAAALVPHKPLYDWYAKIAPRHRRAAVLAILLAIVVLSGNLFVQGAYQHETNVLLLTIAIVLLGLLLIGRKAAFVAALFALMLGRGGFETLSSSFNGTRERSFFGIYKVGSNAGEGLRGLTHGTTLHGLQFIDPEREREPTTYYTRTAGIGLALDRSEAIAGPDARIGVVGLGVGTLACYRKPAQSFEFFEIDPAVVTYSSEGTFTFVKDCAPDAAMHVGDARLVLEGMQPGHFDILVIDAFSSDSIPLHLVTREAFAIYRRVLDEDGLLLVHISNRFIDLQPMVAGLGRANGMDAIIRRDVSKPRFGQTNSVWVALSHEPGTLAKLEAGSAPGTWKAPPPPPKRVWTDDFASILPFLRWDNLLESGL